MYNVFVRTWWRNNQSWPNGLEPHEGRRYYLHKGITTEEEARQICREYNTNHKPGRLSRMAEYERCR